MALDQYYEKVAGDESADPLVGGDRSGKTLRAPPAATKKRSTLTTLAILALAITIFLASVAAVSSAVVHYRLPAATEAALKAQQEQQSTSQSQSTLDNPTSTSDSKNKGEVNHLDDDEKTAALAEGVPFSPIWNHTQSMKSCGGTPDEARAHGCVFDVMMQLWTPPECMDTPLSERFLANGNWTWYANGDASKIYNDEEIRKGNHDVVFVAQSYHRHHCIFAWERLVRAMRNQAPLIEELISYDHVMHCRHKTLTLPSEGAESVRGVVAPTGYTRCASYDVWINNNLPENKMSSVDKRWETMEPWSEMPEWI